MKLEYYKEVLDFSNIEYHIIFLIAQILGQQCHMDFNKVWQGVGDETIKAMTKTQHAT